MAKSNRAFTSVNVTMNKSLYFLCHAYDVLQLTNEKNYIIYLQDISDYLVVNMGGKTRFTKTVS